MRLEELVDQHYQQLSANDRELVTSIFREKAAISAMNSTQAAAFLHISRTTLVRLLKKLGLDTYAQFKLLLAQKEHAGAESRFDMPEIAENYRLLLNELKKYDYTAICQMLYQADTIYLYGSGNEQKAIAEELKRVLLILGKCCVTLFDYGEVEFACQRFSKKDLFVAISLSGEGAETLRVVRCAQAGNIQTLSVTRWENNALARMCQESLYVGTRRVQQSVGQSYELVAAFYILLDILSVRYLEYSLQQKEAEDED
ncbi:MAG: MurR/RpiR family transcriptional regulator [Lachnospiraceae bacterium]|nr:MurR/RpiR family transcriptional regulator [Lachnospiraceae bacterium]MDE6931035.1 MurR/RpiR family transcriptional regulator [Lachnospiraceae bacterium]